MGDQVTGLLSPWLRNIRIAKVRPYLKGRVLDFGCGVGALTEYCQPDNYYGIDIDKDALEVAQTKHPGYNFSNEFPLFEKFDSIIALAVIEHIPDPAGLLEKFKQILSQSGTIIVTTPHPVSDQIHTIGSRIKLLSSGAEEEHQPLLDYELMQKMASLNGLSVLKYERFLLGLNQLFLLGR